MQRQAWKDVIVNNSKYDVLVHILELSVARLLDNVNLDVSAIDVVSRPLGLGWATVISAGSVPPSSFGVLCAGRPVGLSIQCHLKISHVPTYLQTEQCLPCFTCLCTPAGYPPNFKR